MKRTVSALTLVLTLLASVMTAQFVNLASAQAESEVTIQSPQNTVYNTNYIRINIAVEHISTGVEVAYSIDGEPYTIIYDTTELNVHLTIAKSTSYCTEGSHTIKASARSWIPEGTSYSDVVYFTIDTSPPNISILSLNNKSYTTTHVPLNFTVNEQISWMGYSLDGQTNVSITGNTTLTRLLDGKHSIVVYAMNPAEKTGSSDVIHFIVDSTPPKVSVLSPENKTYDTNDILLNFTVNESVSQITYSLEGLDNVTIAGNTTLTGLSKGVHNVTAYAIDAAGNIGASETIIFSIEEPFPTTLVILAVVAVALVAVGHLVYFKKRKH